MKERKATFGLVACVTLAAGLSATPCLHAETVSNFDTNNEGWTLGGDGTISYSASQGNPAGSLQVVDAATGQDITVSAPDKFLGDLTASDGVDTLGFDAWVVNTSQGSLYGGFGTVTLSGGGLTVTRDLTTDVPTSGWASYSTPLTATAWGLTQSEWTTLLQDVTGITVMLEGINGGETDRFDNFHSGTPAAVLPPTTVPLPSTAAMIPVGLLLLVGYRRRAGRSCGSA